MRRFVLALPLVVVLGCGSKTPKADEPKTESSKPGSKAESVPDAAAGEKFKAEEDSKKVPDACADGDQAACVMPKGFVQRMCSSSKAYPELALVFFQKGSPWRRAYVAVKEAAPFHGFSGVSSEEKLVFEEELIVLAEKKVDTGGMQVSGAGSSYDLLRWDGTCATLSAEEVRFIAPAKPKHATIPWRILEDATQEALRQNEALANTAAERKKECKGATMGTVSAKCEKADRKLNDLIFEAVRGGTAVPVPAKVP
jgi:hypothetical protein